MNTPERPAGEAAPPSQSEQGKSGAETASAKLAVQSAAKKKDPIRKITCGVLALCLLFFIWYVFADRLTPYSDQARVQALVTPIVPRVSGWLFYAKAGNTAPFLVLLLLIALLVIPMLAMQSPALARIIATGIILGAAVTLLVVGRRTHSFPSHPRLWSRHQRRWQTHLRRQTHRLRRTQHLLLTHPPRRLSITPNASAPPGQPPWW